MKHDLSIVTKARDLRQKGLTWTEIAHRFNMPVTSLRYAERRLLAIEKAERDFANGIRISPDPEPQPVKLEPVDTNDPNILLLGDPPLHRSALGQRLRAQGRI